MPSPSYLLQSSGLLSLAPALVGWKGWCETPLRSGGNAAGRPCRSQVRIPRATDHSTDGHCRMADGFRTCGEVRSSLRGPVWMKHGFW